MDELYILEKIWPTTQPLATAVSEADGKEYPVIWTSDYHGARLRHDLRHGNATCTTRCSSPTSRAGAVGRGPREIAA